MTTILVVDDEPNIRFVIKEIMQKEGYTILEACDGIQALAVLDENINNVDLVITDLVMPEKNGLDLIMEIKIKQPHLKILAISGGGGLNGRFDYMPIAELVGAESILEKPFNMDELKVIVENILA